MPVIKGIARWASLSKPNDMSGKYQIDVCNLDKKAIAQLKEDGISNVRQDKPSDEDYESKETFVTMRSSAVSKQGETLDPPKTVDAKKNPLPRGTLIGNGSVIKVVYDPFEWTHKAKAGISAGLRIVQVLELEEYKGGSGLDDLEEEEGYATEKVEGTDELDADDDDGEGGEGEGDDEIPF